MLLGITCLSPDHDDYIVELTMNLDSDNVTIVEKSAKLISCSMILRNFFISSDLELNVVGVSCVSMVTLILVVLQSN